MTSLALHPNPRAALRPTTNRISGARLFVSPLGPARLARPSLLPARAATYNVTFKLPDGEERTIQCDDDTYILDAAEEAGLELPYACHGGTCSSCCARVLEGTLDQSEQSYLDEGEIAKGFALICSAYPTSNMVLLTHQQQALEDSAMEEMAAQAHAHLTGGQ